MTGGRWLKPVPADDESISARLLCIPYSGVGASSFAAWPTRVGTVEVLRVQAPGRETRLAEPHYGTYERFADGLTEALRTVADRPFAILGHCSGALAAYETTIALRRAGLPVPTVLVVSSQVGPQDGPYGRYLAMDDEGLRAEVVESTVRRGVRPHPGMVDLSVDILRADVEANRRYRRPRPERLAGTRVVALGWEDDVEIEPSRMTGWDACADEVRRVVLPGGHQTIFEAPEALMALLRAELGDAAEDGATAGPVNAVSGDGAPNARGAC
ncbi:thioesterase II family protein [Kitasatospora sp. NPDC101235]|uniref:thioesterase II family protein n=1 Tax=Kitasatospora sp. NPDC101235 TaxID=3364101 RepID=UPI003803910C